MKKFWRFLRRFILWSLILFFGTSLFFVILYRFINPPVTPLMLIRIAGMAVHGEKLNLSKKWVPLEKISPDLQLAVVASEDNLFLEHHGFDFKAIEKAQDYNERKQGKKVHGASTISQQTAKNVFLWPQRSWVRKGLEVYFTVLTEFFWSKKRIMEVYLNVIEMGDGIYGAEKASTSYFNKPASALTRNEAAMIAAILPNPKKWNPVHPTSYIRNRQEWILWNMNNLGKLSY
ncbi:MAG: monofunctional biosynthetic peptidoglycan transglycosylase [Bacteroidetes bacterium]|nr:monofunctional biosynthetic peptidoglycan transglycosylase [Bacteroidota bacterium]